jgi:hypothetical protein
MEVNFTVDIKRPFVIEKDEKPTVTLERPEDRTKVLLTYKNGTIEFMADLEIVNKQSTDGIESLECEFHNMSDIKMKAKGENNE